MIWKNEGRMDRTQEEVDLFTRLVVFPTSVSPVTTSFRTSTTSEVVSVENQKDRQSDLE
jgi:hypothetical protein